MEQKHLVTAQEIFNIYFQSGESNRECIENGTTAIAAYLRQHNYSQTELFQIAKNQLRISRKDLKEADEGQIVQKIIDKVANIAQRSSEFGDY